MSEQDPTNLAVSGYNLPNRSLEDEGDIISPLLCDVESVHAPKDNLGKISFDFTHRNSEFFEHNVSQLASWSDDETGRDYELLIDKTNGHRHLDFTWQLVEFNGPDVQVEQLYVDQESSHGSRVHYMAASKSFVTEAISRGEELELSAKIRQIIENSAFNIHLESMRFRRFELQAAIRRPMSITEDETLFDQRKAAMRKELDSLIFPASALWVI